MNIIIIIISQNKYYILLTLNFLYKFYYGV